MKLSLKITGAKGSQQCDAASLFGGFWKAKTLMDMHHYVWVSNVPARIKLSSGPVSYVMLGYTSIDGGRQSAHRVIRVESAG
ncbi:hypothetical protein FEAC_19720 [Ferrimicrobium acidiphilum DSM 19497]|uniref:Uncharacterized protein n=1 Tax=Ferrimicrobium acidiphilum DSM 19497 TaxID=1121877 RepID=A0A0D8FVH1_9ACTN|nr:hypothetical protein FEAC_19720 [Ferrimicrobium acidiphilum DSM 19497]